jgi:hypothetical protein
LISPLRVGLLEYYKPTAGASRLVSVLETGTVPSTIGTGAAAAVYNAGGTYAAGRDFTYCFYATRSGSFLGRGSGIAEFHIGGGTNAANLTAPSVSGGGCDGFYVVRLSGGSPVYRWVALASFPYVDVSDTGWTAGVPTSVGSPRSVVPVLWPQGGDVGTVNTTTSPLGGYAFDSATQALWSVGRADLGVRETVTVGFWICPDETEPQHVGTMRGITSAGRFQLMTEAAAGAGGSFFDFVGVRGGVDYADHQIGDWYYVTVCFDNSISAAWLWRITAQRLRDGLQCIQTGMSDPAGDYFRPLEVGDDPWNEVMAHLFGIGGGVYWNLWGSALFDRIGVWNRVLELEEIQTLYGAGLGWSP